MDVSTAIAGAGLLAIAMAGIWFDIRYRRLPNWLCAAALICGIGFGFATGGWHTFPPALLHFAIALAVGVGLFALGWLGAGDAKYYASLAIWFPLSDAPLLLGTVSLAGLALLVAWLPWRMRRRVRIGGPSDPDDLFDKLPYGVAIALGVLATFALKH